MRVTRNAKSYTNILTAPFRLSLAAALVSTFSASIQAQEEPVLEEVVVTGIRASLQSAVNLKRDSDNLVEVIMAEDIGKLPDQNLAEVLENITGVQITRTAGVGTGVQIRGTNANRVEINGVSTLGSGAGRSGIDFEDVNASIIAGVEVIKASEAKTVEGSVGGTINLLTIRPLQLTDTLVSARLQYEESSLSEESAKPRFSGAYGDTWDTGLGAIGFVISGSYTESAAVSFRPRADRDTLSSVDGGPQDFLGIQFLLQEQEADLYETTNIASTLEWAPNENLEFFLDVNIIEQERDREQYRVQASGVSSVRNIQAPTDFETVNFNISDLNRNYQAALRGTIEPDLANDDDDPNLRFTSETDSRATDSEVIRFGGKWRNDKWSLSAELASSKADTETPELDTTLNFINPNCPLDGTSNDNCVPYVYDLSGEELAFGINFDSPFAPAVADLTNPANIVLDQVDYNNDQQNNSEDAFRFDVSYMVDNWGITSVDVGYRFNDTEIEFDAIGDRIGGFSRMEDSPSGLLFEELLVRGPTNYDDADGRDLFVKNFLIVDPDRANKNPLGTLRILEDALAEHRLDNPDATGDLVANIESDQNQYYKIEEETNALYAQLNFASGMFRGNVGVRYVQTDVDSTAYGPSDGNGDRSLATQSGDYSFLLPRLNLVMSPTEEENLLFRLGFGKDIRRPDYDLLNTGFEYDPSENEVVAFGNPGLSPEEVVSWDISAEYYFADASVVSIGYFHKERTDIFGTFLEGAALIPSDNVSGFVRETDPACPGGGTYNPEVVPNVLGDPDTRGMCVDFTIPGNDSATTTQQGIEISFQGDLSGYEDQLGWASGFGVIANYTSQDFSGGAAEDCTTGRGLTALGEVCAARGLLDFSEDAYNFTLYYEKYNLTARMRYTWRDEFRTDDFAGGASLNSTFSFPVLTEERGQLNAAVGYAIGENFNIGLEVTNLTEETITQRCVSEDGPVCFVGNPDRRITLGVSYRM
ncbi:MAG: TonB-dependent receptor [Halieaceae bacterium]